MATPENGHSACQGVVIVVPCYNEEKRLPVAHFEAFLEDGVASSGVVLFVNDGSTDGTLGLLRELCARHPGRALTLNLPRNAGKAEAVRQGLRHASAMAGVWAVGFWDADLATPLDQIPVFATVLQAHSRIDMVFGARIRLLGHDIQRKAIRHYLGRCFASAASLVLKLPVYDTQCGAKLFRNTPLLERITATPFASRWVFDVEILARFRAQLQENGVNIARRVYEQPLPVWRDVDGSKVKASDFLRSFFELLAIRRRYRF